MFIRLVTGVTSTGCRSLEPEIDTLRSSMNYLILISNWLGRWRKESLVLDPLPILCGLLGWIQKWLLFSGRRPLAGISGPDQRFGWPLRSNGDQNWRISWSALGIRAA